MGHNGTGFVPFDWGLARFLLLRPLAVSSWGIWDGMGYLHVHVQTALHWWDIF
jgi:hypothetical protein